MKIEKYGKEYEIDKEIYNQINDYLKSCTIKTLDELLNFCKENEIEEFIEIISKKAKENTHMFKQLKKASKYLSPKNKGSYRAMLLLSTALKNVNILDTIKYDDKFNYGRFFKKFNECSFYLTESKYDKYINGKPTIGDYGDYYGKPVDYTQFVMPTERANELEAVITDNEKTFEERCKSFEKQIGYPEGYLKEVPVIYRIDLDGEAINADSAESIKKINEFKGMLKEMGIYLPQGIEQRANEFFISGGLTSGEIPEAIINSVPNTPRYVIAVYRYEFSEKKGIKKQKFNGHKYYTPPETILTTETIKKLTQNKTVQH